MSCTDNSTFQFIYENCPSSSENEQIIKRHNRIFRKREVPRELSELFDLSLSCPPPPDFNISANYFLKYFGSDDDRDVSKNRKIRKRNKIKIKTPNSFF